MTELLTGTTTFLNKFDPSDRQKILEWRNSPDLKRLTGPGLFIPVHDSEIDLDDSDQKFQFAIRARADETLLGWIALQNISWTNRIAELSIYIGDDSHRGVGHGSDAITVILEFAFNELNLHRVQLEVVSYNDHAIAVYEKQGFIREGALRDYGERGGSRFDLYVYGMLRHEFTGRAET